MEKEGKYFSLKEILKTKAHYYLIYGERSNGKTYAVLKYGLEQYVKNGSQLGYIRRWDTDVKGNLASTIYDSLIANDEISKITKGEWTSIYYYASKWYLCRYEGEKRIVDKTPCAYAFGISMQEHYKSTSYPHIDNILFDEFLTRTTYLNDEFVLFMNLLSTIIRNRNNVKIFMCGNTVNKYCPYFKEMGLKNAASMVAGKIDVYKYGATDLKIAVQHTLPNAEGKPSDVYFAFNNPKLQMIKSGEWELDIYPHCPCKYSIADIAFKYFIKFDEHILQAEIIQTDNAIFTFIHEKTGEIKNPEEDLVFCPEISYLPNWRRRITHPIDDIAKTVLYFFNAEKVFYQDNEVGDIVKNYINWCKTA